MLQMEGDVTMEMVDAVISQADSGGDGKISCKEFIAAAEAQMNAEP